MGFETRVVGMENYATIDLTKEKRLVIVTSTYGDGEMPDNAQSFWDYLKNGTAPRLENLEYSVLALGDRNYVQFCQAGKAFDVRLEELGAKRIHPRTDCDVDYEGPSAEWFGGLMKSLEDAQGLARRRRLRSPSQDTATVSEEVASPSSFGKSNPFPAILKTNRVLNAQAPQRRRAISRSSSRVLDSSTRLAMRWEWCRPTARISCGRSLTQPVLTARRR